MDINKLCKNYIVQTVILFVVMNLIVSIVQKVWGIDLLAEMIVSSSFLLVMGVGIALIWRWVASSHKESLPTFFTAVSGFRLLLALGVMFVWYLTDKNDTMLRFFLVFMLCYVMQLTHHTTFFARLSKHS